MQPSDLIPTYHIPQLVLYQLEIALGQQCAENPHAALPLADTLWKDRYLEVRQAAAFLLGQVPLDTSEAVFDRLTDWCQPQENKTLLKSVLEKGSATICRQQPDSWLALASKWINTAEIPWQSMGLKALLPLIENREFENLPPVFSIINPLIQTAKPELQKDLLTVHQRACKSITHGNLFSAASIVKCRYRRERTPPDPKNVTRFSTSRCCPFAGNPERFYGKSRLRVISSPTNPLQPHLPRQSILWYNFQRDWSCAWQFGCAHGDLQEKSKQLIRSMQTS